jgi:hypothetical protein
MIGGVLSPHLVRLVQREKAIGTSRETLQIAWQQRRRVFGKIVF